MRLVQSTIQIVDNSLASEYISESQRQSLLKQKEILTQQLQTLRASCIRDNGNATSQTSTRFTETVTSSTTDTIGTDTTSTFSETVSQITSST
jgi:hypothetical protein